MKQPKYSAPIISTFSFALYQHESPPESSEEVLRESEAFLSIANAGVADAIADLRAKRVPICFSRNGRIYYEMPDGSIQTENPYPAMMKERGIVLPE